MWKCNCSVVVCLFYTAVENRCIKPADHQQKQFVKDVKQKVKRKVRSEVKANLLALKLSSTSAWLPLKALLLHIKHVNWAVFQALCLVRSCLKTVFRCLAWLLLNNWRKYFRKDVGYLSKIKCVLFWTQHKWTETPWRWSCQSCQGEMQDFFAGKALKSKCWLWKWLHWPAA